MEQYKVLLLILEKRFLKNMHRHPGINWNVVVEKLIAYPDKLKSLELMEESGGEPDVFCPDTGQNSILFIDFAQETPKGRRSLCYDQAALDSRKEYKPRHSAEELAREMGIELLTEEQYFRLQQVEPLDIKTSSWLKTPSEIREKGGAIFGDRRFGRVFIYHNGAESYYSVRGFRGVLLLE